MLRLTHGPDFNDPRLNVIPLDEGGQLLKIRDAIPWTKAELMLATDRGLKLLTLDGDKLTAAPINIGAHPVSRLCRDGRGRLWLGGDGLAFVEASGKAPQLLDDLPMMGRAKIDALAADPEHADGVIAASPAAAWPSCGSPGIDRWLMAGIVRRRGQATRVQRSSTPARKKLTY